MIKKYVYGEPFETEALTENIETAEGKPGYGEICAEDGFSFTYIMDEEDIVYGLGESNRGINKRGFIYTSNCTDDPEHTEDKHSLYGAHNLIIVSGKETFGMFFDYPAAITFDIGYTRMDTMKVTCENADLKLYVIEGESPYDIVKQFRHVIGRSYIPPKFAFGFGQSRWGYTTKEDFRKVAAGYRENHIPIDMIYMDIDYMQSYKDFTLSEENFQDFPEFVKELKDQDIRLIPIIDAGVKVEPGYDVYEEGVKNRYFCQREDGSDFVAAVWPGDTHFPDVLNKDARKWFGDKYRRVQDNSSLGDWVVDRKKLPNGLENLIQTADRNGIKFGIWIEPEAVNSKSELFEKHPDWALQVKGRPLQYGRGGTQMLLDVCNPEVQDFMFGIVDNLLGKHPQIAYIKWDANVELKNYGSTYLPQDKQSHIYIEYHRGLNKVLERIRAKYPDVLIQACGGGGGRASYGVLPYFDEFWVSDNTDALQRIYMQWGTSYFYPSNAMAQHISASPNHQTGRIIPIKFRCDVAMSGRLGMELQPSKMTKEEYQQTAQAIKDYKSVRDVIQLGNLYRLVSPYDDKGIASLMYTDDTENKAVFFVYKMEHFNNQVIPRVCLRGLDPSKNYRVRELNVKTGRQPCFLNGKTFSGALLMNTGIEMPLGSDYASCVLELTAE